ncbi:MAG: hypothetical protein P1Q69_07640 [Candidatus Thorarchaeota archaeon]|nr:hypothetical protein [Candidatus Thorarchaeota archaeon]
MTVTYPPQGAALGLSQIDTIEDREKELKRLLNAACYLCTKEFVPRKVRTCCKKIEDHCKKQFALLKDQPQLRTSIFFLGALKEVQRIILQDKDRKELWEFLIPHREGLQDLLNSENRESLQDLTVESTDLFLLYGNNLFLALLAVKEGLALSHIEVLWRIIAEWTFYQVGMSLQDTAVRTVYNFVSIISKLHTRARRIASISLPKTPSTQDQRVGVIYWEENDPVYDALFLLPQEDGTYLSGVIKNLQDTWLPPKYYPVITDGAALKNFADKALSSTSYTTVIMSTHEGKDILHLPAVDEADELVWISFAVKHGRPAGRHHTIPWLVLEHLPQSFDLGTEPDLPDSTLDMLAFMTQITYEMQQAKLLVSADEELEVFVVDIQTELFSEKREFSRTDDLVRFLQTPVWSATGYRTQRKFVMWDRFEDIAYDDGLSFLKPLVHRSWFFPDEYHYPPTCKEFLTTSTGEDVTLKPVHKERNSYRVKLDGIPQASLLRDLEQVELSKSQLCLLAESAELYDPKRRTMHPVELDVTAIIDEQFWYLHRYPRMSEALDSVDLSEFDWSQDTWEFSARLCYRREVSWSIYSPHKGRTWRNKTFSHLFLENVSVDEALDHFRRKVVEVVALNQIKGVEEKLDFFRMLLLERGWSEEQVREEDQEYSIEEGVEEDPVEQREPNFKVTRKEEFTGVHFVTGRKKQLVATFKSDQGDSEEAVVVHDVNRLAKDTEFSGRIYRERVKRSVETALVLFELEDSFLEDIHKAVEEALIDEGIRFYED